MTDFVIVPEETGHFAAIEALHEDAFGPGRFARAAFRVREQGSHDPALSFVAVDPSSRLCGSVRLTPIAANDGLRGLLLGPLAVVVALKNKGIGRALVRKANEAAAEAGADYVLLVGDSPYYAELGYEQISTGQISLPGPVAPGRLLIHAINPEAMTAVNGRVRHYPWRG